MVIRWGEVEVARSRRATLVLETSHPPSVYLPWDDVAKHLLQPAGGGSFCEWKGPAKYWSLVLDGRKLKSVDWNYPEPLSGAEVWTCAPKGCRDRLYTLSDDLGTSFRERKAAHPIQGEH